MPNCARFYKRLPSLHNKAASKFSDQYNKIIVEAKLPLVESMGGSGDNDFEKEEKIIKNISKKVTINKNMTE